MADIITLGELLIDLTQDCSDENGNRRFVAYPGGAPANVAVAASRLGADTGFIGKIGRDAFGYTLEDTLKKESVDTSGLFFSDEQPTTLAIASIDETGERSFTFYRSPGADTQLTEEEALGAFGESAPLILHIGSLSMTTEPSASACIAAVRYAKKKGALISYDPNYRAALWDSEERASEAMKFLLPYADILKVSDEEMAMLTGTDDLEMGSLTLNRYGPSLVMVTLGSEGVFVRHGDFTAAVPGFRVKVADTNGAGDTFLGAMLARIAGKLRTGDLDQTDQTELTEMVAYANKAASLTCSRRGAIPAMPYADEITL